MKRPQQTQTDNLFPTIDNYTTGSLCDATEFFYIT